ncbi:3311_t:CDS:1, partial [Gigaspora rosea]
MFNAVQFQKRAASFQECSSQLDSLTVTIQPDSITTYQSDPGLFNISGSLSKKIIDNNTLLVVAFGNATGENLLVTPNAFIACYENINPPCPINSGVQFHMEQVLLPVPTDLTSISTY